MPLAELASSCPFIPYQAYYTFPLRPLGVDLDKVGVILIFVVYRLNYLPNNTPSSRSFVIFEALGNSLRYRGRLSN